jgi:hypothetical protein
MRHYIVSHDACVLLSLFATIIFVTSAPKATPLTLRSSGLPDSSASQREIAHPSSFPGSYLLLCKERRKGRSGA